MITINNTTFRNLQEQVAENQKNIQEILQINNLLVGAGVRLVGQVESVDQLPDPSNYAGEYGDAYSVGTATPYDLYVFTRPNINTPEVHWFDIGPFPAPSTVPGPQGEKGETGESGTRGSKYFSGIANPSSTGDYIVGDLYINTTTGNLYQFTAGSPNYWVLLKNIMGPQGLQGVKGDKGDVGETGSRGPQGDPGDPGETLKIVDQLSSTDALPEPTEDNRHYAYLINEHLWIVVGDDVLQWVDSGAIGAEIDPNRFVTTDTVQEISAAKTFSGNPITFTSDSYASFEGGVGLNNSVYLGSSSNFVGDAKFNSTIYANSGINLSNNNLIFDEGKISGNVSIGNGSDIHLKTASGYEFGTLYSEKQYIHMNYSTTPSYFGNLKTGYLNSPSVYVPGTETINGTLAFEGSSNKITGTSVDVSGLTLTGKLVISSGGLDLSDNPIWITNARIAGNSNYGYGSTLSFVRSDATTTASINSSIGAISAVTINTYNLYKGSSNTKPYVSSLASPTITWNTTDFTFSKKLVDVLDFQGHEDILQNIIFSTNNAGTGSNVEVYRITGLSNSSETLSYNVVGYRGLTPHNFTINRYGTVCIVYINIPTSQTSTGVYYELYAPIVTLTRA